MEALKVGDPLEFTAPLGRFVIDCESPRKRVMVGTGTGIAPFRSMLLDKYEGVCKTVPIALYWGLRFKEDMYIQDELTTLSSNHAYFSYYPVLSRPPEDWKGLKGHVTEYVLTNEKDVKNCDFYLCGKKDMITQTQEKLLSAGVPRDQLKFDPFF